MDILKKLFCLHKWNIHELSSTDRLLICKECGKVRVLKVSCDHQWTVESNMRVYDYYVSKDKPIKEITRYTCTKCGKVREEVTG